MPKLKKTKVITIIDDLANSNLSLRDIADKHNITLQTAFFINWGKTNRFRSIDYPIRKTTKLQMIEAKRARIEEAKQKANQLRQRYEEIILTIANTDIPLKDIAKKFRIHLSEITRLNTGERHRLEGMSYPLRQTARAKNQSILDDYLKGELTTAEICAKYNVDKSKIYDIVYYQEQLMGRKLWKKENTSLNLQSQD